MATLRLSHLGTFALAAAFAAGGCSSTFDDANDGYTTTSTSSTTTTTVTVPPPPARPPARPDVIPTTTTATTTSTTTATTTTTTLPPEQITAPSARSEIDGVRLLRWDWAPPCRVPVTDVLDENGFVVTRSLIVTVTPDGADFDVDVEFVDVDVRGLPVSTEEEIAAFARAAAVTLVVDRDGNVVDLRGVDEAVAAIRELLLADPAINPVELDTYFAVNDLRASLETQAIDEFWTAWVLTWVQLGFVDDQPFEQKVDRGLESAWLFRGLGEYEDGTVHLRGEVTYGDSDVAYLLGAPGATDVPVFEGSIHYLVEAIVDPGTLRPVTAVYVADTDVRAPDGSFERVNRHQESTFHWDEAEGCGLT